MAYLTATRYGLVFVGSCTEALRAGGWRQVWRHPSGALAMRNPASGEWVCSFDGGVTVADGFSSGLRAAALRIERRARAAA